jgi:adenine-specific DNA-methyltransferase
MPKKSKSKKIVESLRHEDATRKNIPTAELQPVLQKKEQDPLRVAYERRNKDLDPQLVWRGKDEQDWSDLVVQAPPLYIQEKIHPKVLIDDLLRQTRERQPGAGEQIDLFADFNGMPQGVDKTDFYQHDQNWSNRMILGDSLQVMASLAEREGLRGKVQCIYIDPPYGIKFNSNFQWSTTSRDVKDGNIEHITREPEQVRAFRDTWRDGVHSYLTYLRDRLTVARDLLAESGSIFVQIGDENVHRVRAVMEEVLGATNFIVALVVQKTGSQSGEFIQSNTDTVLWWTKDRHSAVRKFRPLFQVRLGSPSNLSTVERTDYSANPLTSDGFRETTTCDFEFEGRVFHPGKLSHWKTTVDDLARVGRAGRIVCQQSQIRLRYFFEDYPVTRLSGVWDDVGGASNKVFVVQTTPRIIERCILMTTDPGDLVLDPTCGSGTTATVAEQWGRRWITIDTSRVALALARARVMGARYPYYLLADSRDGQLKEAEVTNKAPSSQIVRNNVRHGFVYARVQHVTLTSIAENAEIDVIWEKWQARLEPLRGSLNAALKKGWAEWEIPRETSEMWPEAAKKAHTEWWAARIARQKEIDASINAKAELEHLYDKPYEDKRRVRVAGPFTVESLSPHRVVGVDENDELIDRTGEIDGGFGAERGFTDMILENLKTAGVQQAHKEDKIVFTALTPWPGKLVCADGRYREGGADSGKERRAAIFIGPEFGTVSRPDLVEAAREAGDADFDVLVACAFSYDAHSAEFDKLGRIPVLKARMNADLHMADDLKNTGKGNLFVIFGEPDIEILATDDGQVRVKVKGVDVFHPSTGEVHSDGAEGIACWLIDTDYNEESFFVRHAYFLGANDPYSALKTTLKAEINEEAWGTLHSDTSRAFPKPKSGRIAVKVINHLGDEVMKVFKVS